jgi:hypothetical protein
MLHYTSASKQQQQSDFKNNSVSKCKVDVASETFFMIYVLLLKDI